MADAWSEARRDFPALARCTYLNAASSSPTPRPVRAAVERFYRETEEGGDVHWEAWIERREQVRARVAAFVGATPEEIAFVPNTSTGINLLVDLVAGDGPVLSDELEFPTVTLPFAHRGTDVHLLSAPGGVLRAEDFAAERVPAAATLAVSHVQFSNGCRLDLEALGRLKGSRSLIVSASQSAGAFALDVGAWSVDGLAAAGHKWMCAGYGAGFVYISRPLLERPPRTMGWLSVERPFAFDNRSYRLLAGARRTELGCPAFAGIFALGAAVEYLEALGRDAIERRVLSLNAQLTDRLQAEGFEVLSPGGPQRSGESLVALADPRGAVGFLEQRGVLVTRKPEGLRIATHFYNDERDLEACCRALREWRG
jgi:selenocysteine lyase/cysteine desulfurase